MACCFLPFYISFTMRGFCCRYHAFGLWIRFHQAQIVFLLCFQRILKTSLSTSSEPIWHSCQVNDPSKAHLASLQQDRWLQVSSRDDRLPTQMMTRRAISAQTSTTESILISIIMVALISPNNKRREEKGQNLVISFGCLKDHRIKHGFKRCRLYFS